MPNLTAQTANLKCKTVDYFYKELLSEQYMIDTCGDKTDRTREYSLLIDLFDNQPFLTKECKITNINA